MPGLNRKSRLMVFLLFLATVAHAEHRVRVSLSCAELASVSLPHTVIHSAQGVPAGTFSLPGVVDPAFAQYPSFCRVIATSTPSSDSEIGFEVWLPTAGWNGKFLGTGNDGFIGALTYGEMGNAITYGYATAGTDTGHSSTQPTDASWALGHPEKIIDFGYRAIHEMTASSKVLVQSFYGQTAQHTYFNGCSSGGREALMEAERYPLDYNGILAGDPPANWTHLLANGAYNLQKLTASPAAYLSSAKLPAIAAAVLAACNKGVDTGYLNDPSLCHWNTATLLCKGEETGACLTAPEIKTLNALYAGSALSATDIVFPGLLPGGELGSGGWQGWITGEAPGASGMAEYVENYYKYMVYQNPNWSYTSFTLAQGLADAVAQTGAEMDAVNPNLQPFQANGGKLILYHGWNDPAISAWSTVDYYRSVIATMGAQNAAETVQLFLVPGMQHCGGGPGPSQFGQTGPTVATPAHDLHHSIYAALEAWVEQGVVPERIVTQGPVVENGATVVIARPLCAYPLAAKYLGSGDPNQAQNYECAPD